MTATYGDAVLDGRKVHDAVLKWTCTHCGKEITR